MKAKLSLQPSLARTSLGVTVVAALLSLSAASAAQAPAGEPVPKLNDRHPFLGPDARTSEYPVRIPMKPVAETGPEFAIRGGRLFDAVSGGVRPATVVIQGNRIKAVLAPDATGWGADAKIIDAAGKTVMPGFIDMHTHVTYPDRASPFDEQGGEGVGTLRGQRNLRYFLAYGFTSVRDLNGVSNAPFLLSQWSAADMIPAPRVFAAGWIITGTGAHATERPVIPSHGPDYATEVDGPDAWRSMVSKAFKEGASVIKIASNFAPDEVRAGIEEAHLLGLKVSCDCETIYTEVAVDAGVDMIEHPLPRLGAAITKMAKKKIAAVPTLQVYQNLLDRADGFYGSNSPPFTVVLGDMVTAFLDHGLSHIIVCNGHSTNEPLIGQVAHKIRRERGIMIASLNLWRMIPDSVWQEMHGAGAARARSHGADPVTSVGLHLTPELMRMDAARPATRSSAFGLSTTGQFASAMFGDVELPLDVTEVASNGVGQGDPTLASAESGARFSEWIVGAIADFAGHFRRCDPTRPHLGPLPS
ncbi:MAG: creatininase family protein [Alphaproteobacteria bacterium]|jgi:creatinine amidohydrolase/Fe(II)-dependent formamide hydrolase-like protein|nr:creatininase family protein [Alphaproteobacteria bacterium]MBU1824809.1 creatininase family protein [Alphaproteobacteria bacterium]